MFKPFFKKLAYRSLPGLLLLCLIFLSNRISDSFTHIMAHKIGTVAIGYLTAELLWQAGFKPVFGPMEKMNKNDLIPLAIFRGFLYAAVILGFCIGI